RRLSELHFFTPAGLARARWTLETLPPRAVLAVITSGETYALRVAQLEGARPDVRVVSVPRSSPENLRTMRAAAVRGALGRPMAFVMEMSLDSVAGPGGLQSHLPYNLLMPDSLPAPADPVLLLAQARAVP